MKLHGNLFSRIITDENLLLAHQHARKGKGWYEEVLAVDLDIEQGGEMLKNLKESLINHKSVDL